MKKVVDIYGKEVVVDDTRKKLYSYNNALGEIEYNAPIIDADSEIEFYTNYKEKGVVTDIRERLKTWNNALLLTYAMAVGFRAPDVDLDKKIYNDFVEKVIENEEKFFDKKGDFRKKFMIDPKKLINK